MTALRTLTFGLVGLLSLALMTAQAADAPDKKAKGKGKDSAGTFKTLDKNNDNKLSPEEFSANGKRPNAAQAKGKAGEKLFQRLDSNKDGFLSAEEFSKFGAGAGAQRKKKKD